MPDLDPARYPFARLVVPAHRMPFNGRLFGDNADHPGFERVDLFDGFTHMLLAGGSIVLTDPPPRSDGVPPPAAASPLAPRSGGVPPPDHPA